MATVINPENPEITLSKDEVSEASSVVLWLPCDETGTVTTLTDAVSGETVTIASSTASGGGIAIPNSASSAFSGTLPALSSDFAIMMLVKTSTLATTIGYGTGAQNISIANTSSSITGASGTDTLDAVSLDTLLKILVYVDEDGDSYLYQAAPGVALANTLNPLSAAGVVTPSANAFNFSAFTTNTLYGYAVLDLSTNLIPGDIVGLADWTLEQWNLNNKVLPNWFKEL